MRQRSPLLEEITLTKRHVRFDTAPTNEQKVDRTVFVLTTNFGAKAVGRRFNKRKGGGNCRFKLLFATGGDGQDGVLEYHERDISRARRCSSLATPMAVCASAIAPSSTARSASAVMHAAVNSGW